MGWKLGVGERERIGGEIAVGHLTSATRLDPGATYVASADDRELHVDAELAVELGRELDPSADAAAALAAIAGYGVALEVVDLARPPDDPESVVAANVFHRAVAFGPLVAELPSGDLMARVIVSGELRGSASAPHDLADKLAAAVRILGAVGERVEAGDRIITGSIVQTAVNRGDDVIAAMEGLGEVRLSIARGDAG